MSSEFDDFDDSEQSTQNDAEIAKNLGLSEEQYYKMIEDVENFSHSYLSYLAGTAKYEVVPTEIDVDQYLHDQQYNMIKKECAKIGAKVLYTYNISKDTTVILNPTNLKILVIHQGETH